MVPLMVRAASFAFHIRICLDELALLVGKRFPQSSVSTTFPCPASAQLPMSARSVVLMAFLSSAQYQQREISRSRAAYVLQDECSRYQPLTPDYHLELLLLVSYELSWVSLTPREPLKQDDCRSSARSVVTLW